MPTTIVRTGASLSPRTDLAEPPSSSTSTTLPGPEPMPASTAIIASPKGFSVSGSIGRTKSSFLSHTDFTFRVPQTLPTTSAININILPFYELSDLMTFDDSHHRRVH